MTATLRSLGADPAGTPAGSVLDWCNMKTCEECGDQREDTPLHFPVFRKKTSVCLACVTKHRRRKSDERTEKRTRKMRRMEEAAVDAMLSAGSRGGSEIPHSAELLEQTMHLFGGVNGFAQLLMKQYFDSAPGGPQRTKILEMLAKLTTTNAAQGGSKKPLVMWSEDELEAELDARMLQAVAQYSPHLRTLEVQHGEAAEAAAHSGGD